MKLPSLGQEVSLTHDKSFCHCGFCDILLELRVSFFLPTVNFLQSAQVLVPMSDGFFSFQAHPSSTHTGSGTGPISGRVGGGVFFFLSSVLVILKITQIWLILASAS